MTPCEIGDGHAEGIGQDKTFALVCQFAGPADLVASNDRVPGPVTLGEGGFPSDKEAVRTRCEGEFRELVVDSIDEAESRKVDRQGFTEIDDLDELEVILIGKSRLDFGAGGSGGMVHHFRDREGSGGCGNEGAGSRDLDGPFTQDVSAEANGLEGDRIGAGVDRHIDFPAVVIEPDDRQGFGCAGEADFPDVDPGITLECDERFVGGGPS